MYMAKVVYGGWGGLVVGGGAHAWGVPVLRRCCTCLGLGRFNFCKVNVACVDKLSGELLKHLFVTKFYLFYD